MKPDRPATTWRALTDAGIPVTIVAPGKTPRAAGSQSKSDRMDSRKLALYAEKGGLLTPIAVPTLEQEQDRQLLRARYQTVCKLRRVKQQIKSLLLLYGIAEPPGLT
jgi:transposase